MLGTMWLHRGLPSLNTHICSGQEKTVTAMSPYANACGSASRLVNLTSFPRGQVKLHKTTATMSPRRPSRGSHAPSVTINPTLTVGMARNNAAGSTRSLNRCTFHSRLVTIRLLAQGESRSVCVPPGCVGARSRRSPADLNQLELDECSTPSRGRPTASSAPRSRQSATRSRGSTSFELPRRAARLTPPAGAGVSKFPQPYPIKSDSNGFHPL